ncbi:MAG: hypothetical protein KF873_04545 [Gemmataceae bacterium]|nr:hypothetical protein [Gemmataceae bacterium]
MLAFLPAPPPPDDAGVRLDVRIGNGPARGYTIAEGEFLVGTAIGCDLRLADRQFPPVVCQFSRSDDGLRVRKLSPTVPVYLNDQPLGGSAPVSVQDGDVVRAGPAEIRVIFAGSQPQRPRLVTFADDEPEETTAPTENLADQRAELERQARELDEERAIWYRRKMEMEAELRGVPEAAELLRREAAISARERELAHEYDRRFGALEDEIARRRTELEQELEARRERADREFQDRMAGLEETITRQRLQFEADVREAEPRLAALRLERERIEAARAELAEREGMLAALRDEAKRDREALEDERKWQFARLKELDAALLERHAELTRREAQHRAEREALTAERDQHKEDLLRFDRLRAQFERRVAAIDGRTAEVNERHDLLERTSREWEETLRLAEAEQARLNMEAERIDARRSEVDRRDAELAERGALLESQAASLAMLRATLARRQDEIESEGERLAADRAKFEAARRELDDRLRETERVRAELGQVRDEGADELRTAAERSALLASRLEELHETEERVRRRELELDERSSEFAEQVALLKSRLTQAAELQERLERDRAAVRERESLLGDGDSARLEFQEQLRRRSEELARRSGELDELRAKLAEELAVAARLRDNLEAERNRNDERERRDQRDLETRTRELDERGAVLAEREATLERQVARLREAGEAVATERAALAAAREQFESDRTQAIQAHLVDRRESDELHARIAAQFAELRAQAPDLERGAAESLDRLAAAREVLRGHLAELHAFAKQSREELDAERSRARVEAEQVRQHAQELESARSEHRLAVAGFRQQLFDWQSKIAELRGQFDSARDRIERKGTDVDEAVQEIEAIRADLDRRTREVETERRLAVEKRTEMERHLADMREWYRRKLRELAAGRAVDDSDMPDWRTETTEAAAEEAGEPEPGDRQLGELLVARGLVDANTLDALTEEARRQRKSLRQTLLASGALTVFQLALIEAGSLDGLMLDRLRVIDRLRVTSRETTYRVFDPARPGGPTRGLYILRHLGEAEMQDGVHPDEFRQRFATMAEASHPNLVNTLEVLDIQGRPAALQEWVPGLVSGDWPPIVANPGVWVRLLADAAKGILHAHRAGFVHGRLTADSFVLSTDGTLKVQGFGEPYWLAGAPHAVDPTPAGDLRALGRTAFGWSQLAARRRGARPKPFPAELTTVIRRLEIGAEPSMGDVVAIDRPYADAAELARDLAHLIEQFPCPGDAWEKLVRFAAENAPDRPASRAA